MMNEATRRFALDHAADDVRRLALRGTKATDVDLAAALQQIKGRQAARRKLPSWADIDGILYPPQLSMEQCSSEQTGRYKADIAAALCGDGLSGSTRLIDLTGGFGVDFALMAPLFAEAVYVEQQPELCAIATANFATLGQSVTTVCTDAASYLQQTDHATLVVVDPARRDDHGARTFGIADCTPNVLLLLDELLAKADHVLLKLSPMLDWRKAVADVGRRHVEQVHIVAVGGECKELLLLLSANGSPQPLLVCTNDDQRDTFPVDDRRDFPVDDSHAASSVDGSPAAPLPPAAPATYLYEPHAALMKSGMYTQLAARYGVLPLAPNSHLFTSEQLVAGFPGRAFAVTAISSMNKRELKEKIAPLRQANISVRNFPLSAAQLRQRLKLGDGGPHYLFATTLASGQHALLVTVKA